MPTVLQLHRPEEAADVAAALLHACPESRVFAFEGDLGAGKTTLIKALCAQLGVEHGTSSPSFAIVNDYHSITHDHIYHFDLYRLRKAAELDGIGFVEYIDSGAYCFVEWPELAKHLLPPDTVHVDMSVDPSGDRTISLNP